MEEEIDLRPYFEALLRNWKWIIGAAILSAVVALGVSFLISPTYEASALVAVTRPGQIVQFDPRFEAVDEAQPLKALPELATSDDIVRSLQAEISPLFEDEGTLTRVRNLLEAESGSDPSLIRLKVRFGEAAAAARISNAWAEHFVSRANEIYGDLGGGQVAFFEGQLEEANSELEAAEQALVQFQARDRTMILDNQLLALQEDQAEQLGRRRQIASISQDIEGLRDQLTGRTGNNAVTFADQLTALLLQIKAYGILEAKEATPLQLMITPGESLVGLDRAEQVAFLEDLNQALLARSEQLDERLSQMEPDILALQQQRQAMESERTQLTRDRDLADETYTALARKVQEERITSQDVSSGVRLASQAAVPEEPVSPRKAINTVVAGVLGGMVALVVVFAAEWWQVVGQNPQDRSENVEELGRPALDASALADASSD